MLERLQMSARRYLPEWTLLAVGLGFVVLLAELLMTGHTEGDQAIGVVAALLGAALAAAGLVVRGRASVWVGVLMLALSVSGLVGMAEHAETRAEGAARRASIERFERGEREPIETFGARGGPEAGRAGRAGRAGLGRRRGAPPPLAPLSLSGLALMGAAATLAREPGKSSASS